MFGAVLGTVTVAAATGCAAAGDDGVAASLAGPTWQIVGVYTDPNLPGDLPGDAAGTASLTFGARSMKGQTSCAPLRATITAEGTHLRLDEVEIDDAGNCTGGARHTHDQLAGILTPGASFEVRRYGDAEALLTSNRGELNSPSIRVMTL